MRTEKSRDGKARRKSTNHCAHWSISKLTDDSQNHQDVRAGRAKYFGPRNFIVQLPTDIIMKKFKIWKLYLYLYNKSQPYLWLTDWHKCFGTSRCRTHTNPLVLKMTTVFSSVLGLNFQLQSLSRLLNFVFDR